MSRFDELGLSGHTLQVLKKRGFETPSPIQAKTIPAVLAGDKDIIGQAQTGTGKTAAFGLPIIELIAEKTGQVQALILAPTRELAIQVAEEINSLKGERHLTVIPIYGGQSMDLQLRALKRGVEIVVGTPGRVLDHLRRGSLRINQIDFMVLDEADEMLNMGFLEDVTAIMEKTPRGKRTLLFSATMPKEIKKIAETYMRDSVHIKASGAQLTTNNTDQIYFEVSNADKFEAFCRIIDMESEFYGLVFCRTRVDVGALSNRLAERGYAADALHGDMTQAQREKVLDKLKKRQINILVATDVAARGIDVSDLTHVINFSLPQDPEAYVHRIGRTGRAGKEGIAITFVTQSEYRKLQSISRHTKTAIRKEELPQVKDIIASKRERIRDQLAEAVRNQPLRQFRRLAKELLSEHDPYELLAAMLQTSFQRDLDESRYVEISENRVDQKGKTRLFVRSGKKDGLTPGHLLDYMQNECGIPGKVVRDIEIRDTFSFVTLPFQEAETLLAHVKKVDPDSSPLFTKAAAKGEKPPARKSAGRGPRQRTAGKRADKRSGRKRRTA